MGFNMEFHKCIHPYDQHHNQDTEHFHQLRSPSPALQLALHPAPSTWQPPICLSAAITYSRLLWIHTVWTLHITAVQSFLLKSGFLGEDVPPHLDPLLVLNFQRAVCTNHREEGQRKSKTAG